jgi:hypothetical protein
MANEGSIKFEELPSEVLVKILSFLEIVDFIKCSKTCKRIRVIFYDNSLWKRINLSKKRVPSEFLRKMIDDYGCKCLNLNEAKVIGTLRLKYESQLKILDLSGCSAENQSVFEELLRSCSHLQKLSFTQKLKLEVMSQLTALNGKTLQILNCWQGNQGRSGWNPDWLELSTIKCIIKNCPELKELTFWSGDNESDGENRSKSNENLFYYCRIFRNNIDYLVNNIPPKIETFDFGYSAFGEEQIKILVTRCTKLKELRLLVYTSDTNDSVTHIINYLKPTLEKLVIDYGIGYGENNHQKLYKLKSMPKLKNLDFSYNTTDINVISELRKQLPYVSVNGYPSLISEEPVQVAQPPRRGRSRRTQNTYQLKSHL